MDNKNNLQEVALLRCLSTFSIVVWHTYCSYICWDVAETPANAFYNKLFTRIFPIANMPLFTFLAGYLFCFLMKEVGKYADFKKFLLNKTHRLLIPFIVLGALINLTEYGKNIIDILYGQPNHLWYCLMLFYVFIICWIVEKKISRKVNIVLMILSFMIVCYGKSYLYKTPLGLYQPLYFYCFFYAGCLFREHFEKKFFTSNASIIIVSLMYIICCLFYNNHLCGIMAISHIILAFWIAKKICDSKAYRENEFVQKTVDTISKYSFGVYVLHQWIIWNLTREPHLLSYVKPMLEQHYIVAPIIACIAIFGICLILTHFICKTRVGRYFLC